MWDWLVYAALIVAALAILGGLALLAVRVLQAWRSFKRLRRHVFRDLDLVAQKAEATLDKIESVSDTGKAGYEPRAPARLARAARAPARGGGRGARPRPAVVRVAAVDLGTNTTRLLVADVEDGRVEELHRESRSTRLGEGVDARHRLLPLPIARVRNVLTDYRRTLESLGAERTLAVATSAVRDAENGEAFLGEVEWSYGFVTRLASGDEEAELTRRGVDPAPRSLVLDIGGGSTELVLGDFHVSLPMGSVRFTERYGEDIPEITREATALLPGLSPERAIGVAGTVTQLAALIDTEDDPRSPAYACARA